MSLPKKKTQDLIRKAVSDGVEPQMVRDKLVLKAGSKRFVLSKGETTQPAGRYWADLKSQPLPKTRHVEQDIVLQGFSEYLRESGKLVKLRTYDATTNSRKAGQCAGFK